jgi:formylglycine-generating enzyme required for sulfatase activity
MAVDGEVMLERAIARKLALFVASPWVRRTVVGSATLVALAGLMPGAPEVLRARQAEASGCPSGMVSIGGKFCIDRYEASTEEGDVGKDGKFVVSKRHSPYKPVTGLTVRAVSVKGRVPQGYINRDEAEQACENAGKRLCTDDEWITACKGKSPTLYPYGNDHEEGYCNDSGVSSMNIIFGLGKDTPPDSSAYTRINMNDERLNEMEGTVAPSGKFSKCKNSYGAYDMVGNLHEWTADPNGTFRGGYYLDTHINGDGCDYRTTAHNAVYHDYSTGFRCCYGGEAQKKLSDEKKKEREAEKKASDSKADSDMTKTAKAEPSVEKKASSKKAEKSEKKKKKKHKKA